MNKIKIVEPGFEGFTGNLFGIEFSNGISDRSVLPFEAARIGAAIRIVAALDGGEEGAQLGPSQTLLDLSHVEMGLAQGPAAPIETVGVPEAESNRVYTREDLAQIADAEGITGLRRIGDKINVRGRSIGELIDAILKYQQAQ